MSEDWLDLTPVAALYDGSIRQHGASPPGVGWKSEESQEHRFARLLSVVDDRTPFTVNDLGCGYGALFDHLMAASLPIERYFGYDISREMLSAAAGRLPSDRVELIASDRPTVVADYSFASGIFNVRLEASEDEWAEYVRSVVRVLARQSARGFAFNMMTTHVDYQDPQLYYADPALWFDWCKRELAPRVVLFHDYPLYEWTITARVA